MRAASGLKMAAVVWLLAMGSASAADESIRYIEVSGTGTARAAPDAAAFSAGVESRSVRAAESLDAVKSGLRSLLDALARAGVEARDVATTGFEVSPIYERPQRGESVRLTGYRVSSRVSVRVSDVTRLGELLDIAIEAGASQVTQVRFEATDPRAALAAAREQAVADARAKAEQLATLGGVGLGDVLRITEHSGGGGPPVEMAMMARQADAVPIAAGTQDFTVRLNVRFALR